jgi:hypothetical protein
MDDQGAILENASIQKSWMDAWSPPDDGRPVTGRPLVNLTYAFSFELSGRESWGYHVISLAIHLLAALTLYGLVRRTLELPLWGGRYRDSAWLLALAVQPPAGPRRRAAPHLPGSFEARARQPSSY